MKRQRAATISQAVLEEGLDFALAVGAYGCSTLCIRYCQCLDFLSAVAGFLVVVRRRQVGGTAVVRVLVLGLG